MKETTHIPTFCWVVDHKLGLGHAMRCATISLILVKRGATVCPGDTDACPTHASVIVVDSKVFPRTLTQAAKETSIPIVVIDNLRAPSLPRYDLHIFPHPYTPPSITSRKLRSGSEYIALNPKMVGIKPNIQHGRNLIISMGGTDPNHLTAATLTRLHEIVYPKGVNVLFGKGFRDLAGTITAPRPGGTGYSPFHHFWFDDAHAAIVGFGLTFYEMIYLGIPAMCLTHNNPDTNFVKAMAKHLGYGSEPAWWGGDAGNFTSPDAWRTWAASPGAGSLELPDLDNLGAQRCADLLLGVASLAEKVV